MARKNKHKKSTFSSKDAEALLEAGKSIMNVLPERVEDAWEAWADQYDVSNIKKQGF
jgi:hypothetical protein